MAKQDSPEYENPGGRFGNTNPPESLSLARKRLRKVIRAIRKPYGDDFYEYLFLNKWIDKELDEKLSRGFVEIDKETLQGIRIALASVARRSAVRKNLQVLEAYIERSERTSLFGCDDDPE